MTEATADGQGVAIGPTAPEELSRPAFPVRRAASI